MNKTFITFACAFVFMAAVVVAPVAQAVEATSTATTTTSVSTTTVATTTVATTTPTTNATIAGLLAQLAKLTTLFNELKAKLAGTQAEIKELRADIREGMTDADIKTIQELLASDPTIYPQGIVTGYFGPMTKEAIKRFQAKNGLEVTGEIDTETRAAMDAIIAERKADGKFPIGLLLAPGLKDKFEYKLKDRCDDYVKATTTAAHPCMRVKAKYNFWGDKYEDKKDKMEDKKKMKDDDDDEDDDDSSKVPTMRDAARSIEDAEKSVRDVEKKLTKNEYTAPLSSATLSAIKSDVAKAKKDISDAKAALLAKDFVKAEMLGEKAEELMDDAKDVLEGEDEDNEDDEDEEDDDDEDEEDDDDEDNN